MVIHFIIHSYSISIVVSVSVLKSSSTTVLYSSDMTDLYVYSTLFPSVYDDIRSYCSLSLLHLTHYYLLQFFFSDFYYIALILFSSASTVPLLLLCLLYRHSLSFLFSRYLQDSALAASI